jgi:hypothetical protein
MTEFSVQKALSAHELLAAAVAGVGAGIVGFYAAAVLLRRERISAAPPPLVPLPPRRMVRREFRRVPEGGA